MELFDYMTLESSPDPLPDEDLNYWGEQEWEIVSMVHMPFDAKFIYLLKKSCSSYRSNV